LVDPVVAAAKETGAGGIASLAGMVLAFLLSGHGYT
jgi:hypothetical protein